MDRIQIQKRGTEWVAYFTGPHAAGIVESFGTPVIPTPFTIECPVDRVLEVLRAKNPGVEVTA